MISSFFNDCQYSMRINKSESTRCSSNCGAGQGRRFSLVLFNVGSISMPLRSKILFEVIFADDICVIVHGDTKEEVDEKIKLAVESRVNWYKAAGFVINSTKSEVLGFGFVPEAIVVENHVVYPSDNIKFLGLVLRSDLS